MTCLLFITITLLLERCDSAKILGLFPTPAFSHQQPLLALSYALGEKGHQLTIVTPNPSKEPQKNVREIDLSSLYVDWEVLQKQGPISLQKRSNPFKMLKSSCTFMEMLQKFIFDKPELRSLAKEINGTKYDLIIFESLFYSSLLGFSELVGNPPVIGLFTLHPFSVTEEIMGNPHMPSYMPQVFLPYTDKMTIYERFWNLCASLYLKYNMEMCVKPINEIAMNKFFGNLLHTAEELENNKSMLIISTDQATGYPKPIQPNTILVGPMHLTTPKPLPQDIQKWMDESVDGVIYFSLGSNMKGTSVPEDIRGSFIRAFKQFPTVRVLWKWESDTKIPGQPDNVLSKKWLPQQSILAHPKCRLFISQGGLQSLQEAINFAVPVLAIPIFGDQEYNSRKVLHSGVGLTLEFNEITYGTVHEKLHAMLSNSSFKENVLRLSRITKDKLMPAIDTAIWWVEYVIRHNGAPHLRPAALDLTWYQYYMLDILAIVFAVIFTTLLSIYLLITKAIFRKNTKKLKSN